MIGCCRPIVKHSFLVRSIEEIPSVMKRAFHIAKTGRPGPVVVDVPKDMTAPTEKRPFEYPETVKLRSYTPALRGDMLVRSVKHSISCSKRSAGDLRRWWCGPGRCV